MLRWLSQHGDAVLELWARFQCHCRKKSVEPFSRTRFRHAATILPTFVPNLQFLELSCDEGFMIAEEDIICLQSLTQLKSLQLEASSNGQWSLSTLSPLQHLTAL